MRLIIDMKDAERLLKFVTYKSNVMPDLSTLREFLTENTNFKNHISFCKHMLIQFVIDNNWAYAEVVLDYLNDKSYSK